MMQEIYMTETEHALFVLWQCCSIMDFVHKLHFCTNSSLKSDSSHGMLVYRALNRHTKTSSNSIYNISNSCNWYTADAVKTQVISQTDLVKIPFSFNECDCETLTAALILSGARLSHI